jgi:hypothetical protein
MADYHMSVKTVSRSDGRSATAAAAYRSGVQIVDEKTGEVHDYRRKSGVVSATIFVPEDAPGWAADREAIWNAAEASETRKNSTVAREFEVALPDELSSAQRQELAHAFATELVKHHGCAADVAIHEPSKEGDQRNHHAHILCTTRRLGPSGFGDKTRELDDRASGAAEVTRWREVWAEMTNAALERAGRTERVDHRTLKAQGIDREPTIHLGPAATAIERRGQDSQKKLNHQERQTERRAKAKAKRLAEALAEGQSAAAAAPTAPVAAPVPAPAPVPVPAVPTPAPTRKSYHHPDRIAEREAAIKKKEKEMATEQKQDLRTDAEFKESISRITLQTLKTDFGVDIAPADKLTGEALERWSEAAEDKVFEKEFKEFQSSLPSKPDVLQQNLGPSLAEMLKASFEKMMLWIKSAGGSHKEIDTENYGQVVQLDDLHAVQRTAPNKYSIHLISDLNKIPGLDDPKTEIKYAGGVGVVSGKALDKDRGR